MSKKTSPWMIYAIAFVLAACSMVYELLLAQTLSFFAEGTVTWYSLVLGVYLGSMGIGALSFRKVFKSTDNWSSLIQVEMWLSLIGGMSVILIHLLHMIVSYIWITNSFFDLSLVFYAGVFVAVIAIGFLTGCELPLLLSIGSKSAKDGTSISNRILSVDYLGSLAGALAFPLILIVHMELVTLGVFVGLINVLVAGILQVRQPNQSFKLTLSTMLVCLYALFLVFHGGIQQYFLKKYYYYQYQADSFTGLLKSLKDWPKIHRESSPYQKIDMVYYPPDEDVFDDLLNVYTTKFKDIPDFPRGYVLFIDGFFQFLIDIEDIYHEYFAHAPIIFNNHVPRDVLVLGAGDGMLIRELVKYKEVEKITVVEIDPKMVEMARRHPVLEYVNQRAFNDPRVEVIIQDAYHFVRHTGRRFDAIYMDFPRVKDYNLSKLYSVEFFSFVYHRLNDNGFAALDAPEIVDLYKKNYWGIYYSSLAGAGFKTIFPFFSTLESDNPEAIKILEPMFDSTSRLKVSEEGGSEPRMIYGRDDIVKQMISDFVHDHRNSFIFVKKELAEPNTLYRNFGLRHQILNSKRFGLTLQQPVAFPPRYDANLVNSIMKPTLPHQANKWRMRVPY